MDAINATTRTQETTDLRRLWQSARVDVPAHQAANAWLASGWDEAGANMWPSPHHMCRVWNAACRKSPSMSRRRPPAKASPWDMSGRLPSSFTWAFCLIPNVGPLKSGREDRTADPKLYTHIMTAMRSFCSARSTVEKTSFSMTPIWRHARMKDEMFSIFLKGIVDLLIFGTMPGTILFTTRHNSCPSSSHSP